MSVAAAHATRPALKLTRNFENWCHFRVSCDSKVYGVRLCRDCARRRNDKIRALYLKEGGTCREIAENLGTSDQAVRDALARLRRDQWSPHREKPGPKPTTGRDAARAEKEAGFETRAAALALPMLPGFVHGGDRFAPPEVRNGFL